MQRLLFILTFLVLLIHSSKKYTRKKAKIVYEYLPQVILKYCNPGERFNFQDYKDPETLVCQSPSSGSNGGGGGSSVWGYLTAAVVATNVVANIVNNANENNNNNNNNNNNQDNTNNNNMNIGNSANSNMNMNMVIPVPGGRRSFEKSERGNTTEMSSLLNYLFCSLLSPQNSDKERNHKVSPIRLTNLFPVLQVVTASDLSSRVNKIAMSMIILHTFQKYSSLSLTTDLWLDYPLGLV